MEIVRLVLVGIDFGALFMAAAFMWATMLMFRSIARFADLCFFVCLISYLLLSNQNYSLLANIGLIGGFIAGTLYAIWYVDQVGRYRIFPLVLLLLLLLAVGGLEIWRN